MKDNFTFAGSKLCPKCGQSYNGHPAISREDNLTLLCPDCGIREALDSLGLDPKEQEHILTVIHRYRDW